jgi:hypothetical protein
MYDNNYGLHCDGSVVVVAAVEPSSTGGVSSSTTPYSAWTETRNAITA